ncbi:MAG TPA: ferritin-like domain-containing protein [Puia sp.]|nr:ferritin-like domain-containing protein [Puia sp.]
MSTTLSNPATAVGKNSKLQEFFVEQLQDIYWAEQKLVKTLPKMAEAAHSHELQQAFEQHLRETENHVTRLERVFAAMGEKAKSKKCLAMAGIVDEGEDIIDDTEENTAQRDVGLIFAGQKAEHYEIATYGGLVQLARTLGYEEAAREMSATLEEEKKADSKLTSIGENSANPQAGREPKNK